MANALPDTLRLLAAERIGPGARVATVDADQDVTAARGWRLLGPGGRALWRALLRELLRGLRCRRSGGADFTLVRPRGRGAPEI